MTLVLGVLLLVFGIRPPWLAPSVRYLPPIDTTLYVSSTFAETRAAHFHAALDYGTYGRTGYPVYASRSGVISRVAISPLGYGLALWLRHEDGSSTQYAHLDRFHPRINALVDSIRLAEFVYLFDRNVEIHNLRFRAGEIIAWSGDTGAGPAHLHFEIRSPDNHAVNPFLVGFDMPDAVAPVIQGLAVEPLAEHTRILGKREIREVRVSADGNQYRFPDIRVTGPVGLAVQASDRSDNRRNVYAAYSMELLVGGRTVFVSTADSFRFEDQYMMQLDRIFPILRATRRAYQRLYTHDGNTTPFYRTSGNGGRLNLPNGRHEVRIRVRDFHGNTAELAGALVVEPYLGSEPEAVVLNGHLPFIPEAGGDLTRLDTRFTPFHNWLVVRQRLDSVWVTDLSRTGGRSTLYPRLEAGDAILLKDDVLIGENTFHRVYPGRDQRLFSFDGRMRLQFGPQAVYDTLSLAFGYEWQNERPLMTVWQPLEPFRRAFQIGFRLPETSSLQPGWGVYAISGTGDRARYAFLGGRRDGDWVLGTTSAAGRFTVLVDSIAPSITTPTIARRGREFVVNMRISDPMSGINWNSASVWVNGERGIPETDGASRLTYSRPGFRPQARNEVRVVIYDRQGNRAERTFTVNYR